MIDIIWCKKIKVMYSEIKYSTREKLSSYFPIPSEYSDILIMHSRSSHNDIL